MAKDPTGTLVFIVAQRTLVGLVLGTADPDASYGMPSCDGLTDLLTGCGDIWGMIATFVVGTVPGTPWPFSLVLASATNIALGWAILTLLRGN